MLQGSTTIAANRTLNVARAYWVAASGTHDAASGRCPLVQGGTHDAASGTLDAARVDPVAANRTHGTAIVSTALQGGMRDVARVDRRCCKRDVSRCKGRQSLLEARRSRCKGRPHYCKRNR